jgi:hypothetical protein
VGDFFGTISSPKPSACAGVKNDCEKRPHNGRVCDGVA